MKQPDTIVCALADHPTMVAGSSFEHSCGTCGRRVMIAPSGQRALKQWPMRIICVRCAVAQVKASGEPVTAQLPEDFFDELDAEVPNTRRNRN